MMFKMHDIRLPKINEKATKKAVEKVLILYRDYLITLPSYMFPKVTPSYSLVPPTNTNAFHSSTEDAALDRIEYEEARDTYLQTVMKAVNSLKEEERLIIVKKYLQDELGYDPDIWLEVGVGKTKYYQIKGAALLRLAFALKIESYHTKNEVKGV